MSPNFGFIGGAGSGKTTSAKLLVNQYDFHRHALANPMKTMQGWITFLQANRSVPYRGADQYAPQPILLLQSVNRIIRGMTGKPTRSHGPVLVPEIWEDDTLLKTYFADFVNQHKKRFRTPLQYWGSDIMRAFAKEWEEIPDEPWVSYLLSETATSAQLGHPTTCDDIRHPHEATQLTPANFLFVRLERDGAVGEGIDETNAGHESEQHWREIPAHFLIENNGDTTDLAALIRTMNAIAATVTEGRPPPRAGLHSVVNGARLTILDEADWTPRAA